AALENAIRVVEASEDWAALVDSGEGERTVRVWQDQLLQTSWDGTEEAVGRRAHLLDLLGRLLLGMGKRAQAIPILQERLGLLMRNAPPEEVAGLWQELARMLDAEERREESIEAHLQEIRLRKTLDVASELDGAWNRVIAQLSGERLLDVQRDRLAHWKGEEGAQKRYVSARNQFLRSLKKEALWDEAVVLLNERLAEKEEAETVSADDYEEVAVVLEKAGRGEEALPLWEARFVTLTPGGDAWRQSLTELAERYRREAWGEDAWELWLQLGESPNASVADYAEVAYRGMILGVMDAEDWFEKALGEAPTAAEDIRIQSRWGWGLLASGRFSEAYRKFGMARAEGEGMGKLDSSVSSDIRAGLAAAGWVQGAKAAALDEYEGLYQSQVKGERWEDADYLLTRDFPDSALGVLQEVHAIWEERMHAARTVDEN
ncbi:MAG: hypothetical protein AAGJ31_12100, partial [Verrucomicrobiota bacterium]